MLKQLKNIAQRSLGQQWANELEVYTQGAKVREEGWAPIVRSMARVPEVFPEWVVEHTNEFRIVDVRGPDEYYGPFGHIEGSDLVPLYQLQQAVESWDRQQPIVLVCRSGARSGRAALLMEQMGFEAVASMAGGMMRWSSLCYPIPL